MPHKIDHLILPSNHNNKQIGYDVHLPDGNDQCPIIIFCHGFKGFKDWGHFDLVAQFFAAYGFATFKINFSHNGTTPEHPIDFVDLEAFGNNNFSIELDDLNVLISHITRDTNNEFQGRLDTSKVFLVGHSKGGSTTIIKAKEDTRIAGLVTWAAVCNIYSRYTEDEMGDWKEKGVKYIYNGRTDQNMPLYYQLAEDVMENKKRFDIPEIVKSLDKPFLIIHGAEDETVVKAEAEILHTNTPNSELEIISGTNHTFDGSHPWMQPKLPIASHMACQKTIKFLKGLS